MSDYLEIARSGRNDWWRYVLSLPGILFVWLFIGSLPIVALLSYVEMDGNPSNRIFRDKFYRYTGRVGICGNHVVVHSTPRGDCASSTVYPRTADEDSLDGWFTCPLGTGVYGAGVWFCIAALIATVESILYPGRYVLTFQPVALLLFTAFAFILIPIQTSAEEVFFRGYLLQWMGLGLKNKWLLSLINGILFFLPHAANPEMATNSLLVGLGYFAIGFFFTLITVQDDGMELALGAHAANNLFAALFANYTTTAMPSPALFTVQVLDPVYSLVSLIVGMTIFYLVFFRPTRSGNAALPQ